MSIRLKMPFSLLIVCLGMFLFSHQAQAATAVAKITSFKGEVVILSDTQFTNVTQAGLVLNEGDRVQTKQGEAEVTFLDGSVMKMSAFTNAMIQEREEESGWLFKSKASVRRLTIFVGKLWFKSGASQTKNVLQTPTAVCGLRGSEGEIGYDNVKSFLNMISGETQTIGDFVKGVFENPGVDAALKSQVYQAIVTAQNSFNQAKQTGSTQDMNNAKLSALQAIVSAAQALLNNPDPAVAKQAREALKAAEDQIRQMGGTPSTTIGEMTTTSELPTLPTTTASIPLTTTTTTTTSNAATTTTSLPTTTSSTSTTTTTTSAGSPIGTSIP